MDWKSRRRFLKADFNTTLHSHYARYDIQFGNALRPTTRNNTLEQAMFEVTNHKYTDLSETQYGISILNDCKYGISVENSDIRLSLHKGGTRPDPRGDAGLHYCTYSLLPHNGCFNAADTILPSYMLNNPIIVTSGDFTMPQLGASDHANVIVETIKPLEDSIAANEKAYILRVYEAEGCYTKANIRFGFQPKSVVETNMLEEFKDTVSCSDQMEISFRPFEIKTFKVSY
jgi:alpha-mannosidase